MSYIKAKNVLPANLLKAVQKYINGSYLYIPRKKGMRTPWGARTGSKSQTARRNRQILSGYVQDIPVKELAKRYFITDKTVYKILASMKYKK